MSAIARHRFRLVLQYDGRNFHGWQHQRGARTVEGCLRDALRPLGTGPLETAGASRTDTGVHALGQCAMAEFETRLSGEELGRAIHARTPADLAVLECRRVVGEFHPRFDALEKRYLYRIVAGPRAPVFGRGYAWWVREPLRLDVMQAAAQLFVGEHDFGAFRNRSKDEPEETIRTLRTLDWRADGPHVFFQVIGRAFLYRMVRNLVGTLVEVGRGKVAAEALPEILRSRDRRRAPLTAPPEGLYLMDVAYPDTPRCTLDPTPPLF